ncbi:MAG: Phage tail sheath monomer [uncultured Gemmatimonadetes bacterium]|uniref:Phage tail sheath monomer n=1 Tax=uncultured Gemmatimonadota bacterium TaxID=203437 RepID=A0A6J4N9R5_9BACT|nr:MAG: Phage tail sheath monomer [uncultured Gemmatimonadota bacterium]
MPAAFLHGAETIELTRGTRPVRAVRTAVVGIVGTAPIHQAAPGDRTVNRPVVIANETDAARYFGARSTGFTIPAALAALFARGRGVAIVVNVFDPAVHKAAVASASFTFNASDTITLPHQGVSAVVVKNAAGTTTYVADTDYTLDAAAGRITRKAGGALAAGAAVTVAYDRPDPSAVTAAQVNGATDGSGNRTGMQALLDSATLFGFTPKLLIAPGFSTLPSVTAELASLAGRFRAHALVDAPVGTPLATVLAGRGAAGTINFNVANKRVDLCYPYVRVFDAASGAETLEPLSQHAAALIASVDDQEGYHVSPSNHALQGVIGLERPIGFDLRDAGSEANRLNEAGIVTVINAFGTGFRLWGNRSSAFPGSTHPEVFIPVQRTADLIAESIEQAAMERQDQPIGDALIDAIKEDVNSFLRTLVARGALIDGECRFDPAQNPSTEIAAGHLTFDYDFMPPPPLERVTMRSTIDLQRLGALGGQST